MADRTPIFEMHIRPLFSQLDRQHMLRVKSTLDLWDYDSVKAAAPSIIARSCGDNPTMPTAAVGGAWPMELRALFSRWVATGCRRLTLGTGQGYKIAAAGGRYTLTCQADVPDTPDGDSAAWFEILDPEPAAAVFKLYVFPGEAVPPPQATFSLDVSERVDQATATNGVTVIDAAGIHKIVL